MRRLWIGYTRLDTELSMKGGRVMTQKRKNYDRQFKLSASKLMIDEGMSVKELSEDLNIKDVTLRRWSKEYEELGDRVFPGNGSSKLSKTMRSLN